jgi:hypothetical protein
MRHRKYAADSREALPEGPGKEKEKIPKPAAACIAEAKALPPNASNCISGWLGAVSKLVELLCSWLRSWVHGSLCS